MKYRLVNENFKANYGENLLKSRGVENVSLFLSPTNECLQDPINLNNIHAGATLLINTIDNNGKILIVVDSDTDGFTSAAIIYQYIHRINKDIEIEYLLHEGKQHGLEDHINTIMDSGKTYNLIILPDSSSNDLDYHEQLKGISLPCLVLDHHLTDVEISSNAVVINNQLSPNYINKELTGAGVVYQFCRYLDSLLNVNYADDYMDLAALGVIGDMGSMLTLENRYLAVNGLNEIHNFLFKSILDKQSFSTGGKVNPITVAFYVVPLINAMIRVGTMDEKTRLFEAFIDGTKKIPSGKRGAKGVLEYAAIESVRECTNARTRQNKILDDAVGRLEAKVFKHDLLENKILFVRLDDDDEFPSVLNGLCAMKLAAKFKKPTIVARLNDEGYIRGSARAVSNSPLPNLKSFFTDSGFFEYAMGHEGAHGISISNRRLSEFHNWANKELADVNFGEGVYDVNFSRAAADKDIENIVFDLAKYENTWGQNNPEALIYIHDLNITRNDYQIMGKNQDTLKITKFGVSYMKFHAKELIEELEQMDEIKINLIGKPNVNEWMGRQSPQIFIEAYELEDNKYGF